jgi:hypothetical protein
MDIKSQNLDFGDVFASHHLDPRTFVAQRMKKKVGRPRKKKGVISVRDFARAGVVQCAYDEARVNGEKHSVGVKETVKVTKQRHPNIRISETGVKRILAQHRPKKSQTILRFARETLIGKDLARLQALLFQMPAVPVPQPNGMVPALLVALPTRAITVYKISVEERPNYPRHNRKHSKE